MKLRPFRFLVPVIGVSLFFAALGFAVKNSGPATIHYYLGFAWEAPLVVLLLLAFAFGAVAGLMAGFIYLYRQRREILCLKRELRAKGQPKAAD